MLDGTTELEIWLVGMLSCFTKNAYRSFRCCRGPSQRLLLIRFVDATVDFVSSVALFEELSAEHEPLVGSLFSCCLAHPPYSSSGGFILFAS